MDKSLSELISKKNEYLNQNEYEKANEIRKQIKDLKSHNSKNQQKKPKTKTSQNKQPNKIPQIPKTVIIDNLDVTQDIINLKDTIYIEDANSIYNFILNICMNRKNYINRILKRKITSYEVDMKNIKLKKEQQEKVNSISTCPHIKREEQEKKVQQILEDITSYDIDIDNINLKRAIQKELIEINKITEIITRLLINIKREKRTITKEKTQKQELTKRQIEILNQMYTRNISECNIDDYLLCFIELTKQQTLNLEDTIFFIKDFYLKFDKQNIKQYKKFNKQINSIIKNFKRQEKQLIKSLLVKSSNQEKIVRENDYRYEILIYLLKNNEEEKVDKFINKFNDFKNNYYENKSIMQNIFNYLFEEYNNVLKKEKTEFNIELLEQTIIKLYKNEEEKIIKILDEYIYLLHKTNCSTVQKNLILQRINNMKFKIKEVKKDIIDDLIDESYNSIELLKMQELKNTRRRKHLEDSIVLENNNALAYSVIKNDEYINLKLHIIDLTYYFINGTKLEQMLINSMIDETKLKNYIKIKNDREIPCITYEFMFNKGILVNSIIYDSIITTKTDKNIEENYKMLLQQLNIEMIQEEFQNLVKIALENEGINKCYITRVNLDNKYYKQITDLAHILSKLDKKTSEEIHKILIDSSTYIIANTSFSAQDYTIDLTRPSCNYIDIQMQKIIKNIYNKTINIDTEEITENIKQYKLNINKK